MIPGLDCDGVLADTERHGHLPAFNRTFREFGLPVQWSEEEYGRIRAHSSPWPISRPAWSPAILPGRAPPRSDHD